VAAEAIERDGEKVYTVAGAVRTGHPTRKQCLSGFA
jgi:hypothetical protein